MFRVFARWFRLFVEMCRHSKWREDRNRLLESLGTLLRILRLTMQQRDPERSECKEDPRQPYSHHGVQSLAPMFAQNLCQHPEFLFARAVLAPHQGDGALVEIGLDRASDDIG